MESHRNVLDIGRKHVDRLLFPIRENLKRKDRKKLFVIRDYSMLKTPLLLLSRNQNEERHRCQKNPKDPIKRNT